MTRSEGRLVEVEPGRYKIVHEKRRRKEKRISNDGPSRAKPPKENEQQLFLSKDRSSVVDSEGNVVTEEVLIVRVSTHNSYEQVYVRFVMPDGIWSGFTIRGPEQRLRARLARSLTSLDTGLNSERKQCPKCGSFYRKYCKRCKSRSETPKPKHEKIKECEGCGKMIDKRNVTGLCKKCLQKTDEAEKQRRQFNPFYRSLPPPSDKIWAPKEKRRR